MKFIDISMKIDPKIIIYPGNPKPLFKQYASIPASKTNETLVSMGTHTGTHIDAILHIEKNGLSADKIDLKNCYGNCIVIDLTKNGSVITAKDLQNKGIKKNDIVLLKTENSLKQYSRFRKNFAHISLCAAKYLVSRKIKAVGIDYLSVKKFNTDDDVHELLIKNMVVYEGLYLVGVTKGRYTFVGFPIKWALDGSPTRAVLIKR